MSKNENKDRITLDIPEPICVLFNHLISEPSRNIQRGLSGCAEIHDPTVTIKSERLYMSLPVRIDSFCKLECGEGMYIGKNVHIASFCHLGIGGGLLILEDGSSCASGVKIITGSNQPGEGHGCSAIDPAATIKRSFVHVKRNATLYTGAIVCPGVTIEEGAVVLPGAVVTKDVPKGETWGGVPARRISSNERINTKDNEVICSACHSVTLPGESFTHLDSCPFKPGMRSKSKLLPLDMRYAYFGPGPEEDAKRRLSSSIEADQLEVDREQIGILRDQSDIRKRAEAVDHKAKVDAETATCPACQSLVKSGSAQCLYCGRGLDSEEVVEGGVQLEHTPDRWVAAQAEMYCWDEAARNQGYGEQNEKKDK